MEPFRFPGSIEIKPLKGIHDEGQYFSVWAASGKDQEGQDTIVTAWKPSYEDLQALNRGEPVYINVTGRELPSMNVFTLNEDGYSNDPGLEEKDDE